MNLQTRAHTCPDCNRMYGHNAGCPGQEDDGTREYLRDAFLKAAAGDHEANADFAPRVHDWRASQGKAHRVMRYPKVREVLADSLDYSGGPSLYEVLAFVVNAARAGDATASQLVSRMADAWAEMNKES